MSAKTRFVGGVLLRKEGSTVLATIVFTPNADQLSHFFFLLTGLCNRRGTVQCCWYGVRVLMYCIYYCTKAMGFASFVSLQSRLSHGRVWARYRAPQVTTEPQKKTGKISY